MTTDKKMKPLSITDIVEAVVQKIQPKFKITSVDSNPDGTFTLNTCDTFYLFPCKTITINGQLYQIDSFVQDESITVTSIDGGDPSLETEFDLYTPHFFHGSPILVNEELTDIQYSSEKTPVVYLYQTFREQHFEEISGSPVALEADVVIYFLDDAKWEEWTAPKHQRFVIDPMKSLAKLFIDEIQKDRKNFAQVDDFELTDRANFGKVVEAGTMKSWFNDMFSGVELRMTIQYKSFKCIKGC